MVRVHVEYMYMYLDYSVDSIMSACCQTTSLDLTFMNNFVGTAYIFITYKLFRVYFNIILNK